MNAATVRHIEFGDLTDEQMRVHRAGEALNRDGASPAGALELLAAIIEDRTWERVSDAKGRSFRGRFREFVEARTPFGLGFDADQLPKVIGLRHPHESTPRVAERMAAMRAAVSEELRAEIQVAFPVGTPGHGPNVRATPIRASNSSNADTERRVIARLKRDDPALADRVVRGEVTPNAAAREKGWRKPRIVVSTPERIADSLRKYMTADDIAKLIALLAGISLSADSGRD
jgi:hypothetical protein